MELNTWNVPKEKEKGAGGPDIYPIIVSELPGRPNGALGAETSLGLGRMRANRLILSLREMAW